MQRHLSQASLKEPGVMGSGTYMKWVEGPAMSYLPSSVLFSF